MDLSAYLSDYIYHSWPRKLMHVVTAGEEMCLAVTIEKVG